LLPSMWDTQVSLNIAPVQPLTPKSINGN